MDKQLTGKVAIVTGSDSGMGQAIAEEFARHGADVAVSWFTDESGAQETKQVVEQLGQKAIAMQVDVRDASTIARLFAETGRQLGIPFIFVNDAGIDSVGKHVVDMTAEEWDDRFKTNVYGPFYACQQFIRARRTAGGQGKIINITSVHEDIPRAGRPDTAHREGHCATSPVAWP